MTQGALLFAQNNGEIDYVRIARFAAEKIKQHLNVPVSIVTNTDCKHRVFDQVIQILDESKNIKQFRDGNKTTTAVWKNTSRSSCFDLTPYEETLVIDVDYIVNSPKLNYCWNQPFDFLIYKDSCDVGFRKVHKEFEYVSDYSIPFYWATVFFFRKTAETEAFFILVDHIKSNWDYYKLVYNIHSPSFRNDIAFSIALHMINGFTNNSFAGNLPGKLHNTFDFDHLVEIKDNDMKFLVQKQSEYISLKTQGLDMHVMNKYSLLRCIDNV